MGQVTERHTYRMARGSDGNIYFSTRSGVLKRILVDEKRVENLNISLPNSSESRHLARSYMSTGVNGPDGKLYISGQFHDELSAFDPKTGCLEVIGRYMQEEAFMPGPSNNAYIGAMDFDEEGVLWYLINGLRHDRKEDFKPACVLMRWDFLKGKRPERLGLAGTKERAITTSVGVFIDKAKDILYMVSTNHADEGPDITAVDLKTFRKDCCNLGPVCEDVFILPGNDAYTAHAENLQNTWRIIDQNSPLARFKEIIPVRLWNTEEKYPPEETKVANLVWKDGILHGICSGKSQLVFRIRLSGELCFLSPLAKCNEVYRTELLEAIKKEPSELLDGLDLPAYPGRNYKAKAKLSCPLDKRRTLIATEDGLLSIVNLEDKSVYALGAACSNGPVHAMVTGESGIVYGIAGDQADLGNIFTYDDKRGLRNLGRLATDGYRYGNAASCELSCLALNEKEGILAVGAKDDLGCVYLCKL